MAPGLVRVVAGELVLAFPFVMSFDLVIGIAIKAAINNSSQEVQSPGADSDRPTHLEKRRASAGS